MLTKLRILFWSAVHTRAELLWHWVWRVKLEPLLKTDPTSPLYDGPREMRYTFIREDPATADEQARGIVAKKIYRGHY